MPIKALLGIGTATVAMTLLAWPVPPEEKSQNAIRVVRAGSPSPSADDAWAKPDAIVASGREPLPVSGKSSAPRYLWEGREVADGDPPGDPGIWATPAEFALPE